jgi:hypothetical protein
MDNTRKFVLISSIACIIAAIGEFLTIFILGTYYPGYNQLHDTMSSLGASISPVSDIISNWWIIMGFLFMIFGTGVFKAFSDKPKKSLIAAICIILYGLGEGIGSGAFKADHTPNGLTNMAIVHDALGGIGVAAILIFPLFMLKVIERNENQLFHRISKMVFATGILTIVFFMSRFLSNQNNFFAINKGLWQRLFMLNTYIYFVYIAILMIKQKPNTK